MSRAEDQLHKCPTLARLQLEEAREWRRDTEGINRYHAKLEARLDHFQDINHHDSMYLMLDGESEKFIAKSLGLESLDADQRTPPS